MEKENIYSSKKYWVSQHTHNTANTTRTIQQIQHAQESKYNTHNTEHTTGKTQHKQMDIWIQHKRKRTNLIQEFYEQQNQVDHYLQSLPCALTMEVLRKNQGLTLEL